MLRTSTTFKIAFVSVVGTVVSIGCSNSSGACAEMESDLQVEPKQVSKSGSFEVYGEGFGELVECDDTSFVGEEPEGAQFEPLSDISVELRQGSQTWKLATVESSEEATFSEKLRLPAEAVSGQATVTADGNQGTIEAPISVTS